MKFFRTYNVILILCLLHLCSSGLYINFLLRMLGMIEFSAVPVCSVLRCVAAGLLVGEHWATSEINYLYRFVGQKKVLFFCEVSLS